MRKLLNLIESSTNKNSDVSSSRIFSYIMMIIIFIFGITCILIEIANAINSLKKGISYIIPSEHIIILGMWLAHQLTLLGIYKTNELRSTKLSENQQAES